MIATGTVDQERRRDPLLRTIVQLCVKSLGKRGFHLARRGSSADHSWVQLGCPARDSSGHEGTLMVLVAHGRQERTVMVDAYFVDAALGVQTPRHKVLHRYAPESELPRVVREVADAVDGWQA
ncbi:MAG TPA: hypothetical protein VFE37_27120 [Chloroflexota bacterium]|nr:hypothetical protein [Chloroflexota bacterium]